MPFMIIIPIFQSGGKKTALNTMTYETDLQRAAKYLYLQKYCSYVLFFYVFMAPIAMPMCICIVFMAYNDVCENMHIHLEGKIVVLSVLFMGNN